ncbi:MAG: nucleoside recognition domain-containing protein [Elusimicrobiota bacterium]|nr:spore maturation protein [Endomicrobiia bacterium]MDW8165528.1 nucleoside recognition domain-containing protein [Elusimicrobiota bacterium]
MKYIHIFSQTIVPTFILFVVVYGVIKKIKIYDSFINGAKEGFNITLKIFPYILAIFIAIKTFQTSGVFDYLKNLFSPIFNLFGIPIEVLTISLIKPLSGSASLGIFIDIVKTTGADSLASKISAVIMGSAETTFYVLAIYLGAVGIKKTKYLLPVCILSDFIGIIIAIIIVKLVFG